MQRMRKCKYKKDRENQRKKYKSKKITKKVCGVGIPEPVSQSVLGFYPLLKCNANDPLSVSVANTYKWSLGQMS